MDEPRSRKQIRLTVFANEPLARLAEQPLGEQSIRCLILPLGAGPGGWGVATYMHHAMYVKAADEMRARQVLDLPPAEIMERYGVPSHPTHRVSFTVMIVLVITVAALLFGALELPLEGIIY